MAIRERITHTSAGMERTELSGMTNTGVFVELWWSDLDGWVVTVTKPTIGRGEQVPDYVLMPGEHSTTTFGRIFQEHSR